MDARPPAPQLDPGLTGQPARPVEGIDNGYLAGYRVRFDEAGPDGRARASTLLRYAQDVAWRHSEDLGFDRGWYRERGLGWVVRGVELELREPIPMGHTLRVSTAVVGHRRIWARRLGECALADGRLASRVTTDWVLLDSGNRVVRIPEHFGLAFTDLKLEGEILRVRPPSGDPVHSLGLAVRAGDLDPLDHVNNAVYLDWIEEALDSAGWPPARAELPRSIRLEYVAAATHGDAVAVDVRGRAEDWTAVIRRADGADLVRATGSRTTGA